jgi:hypothetical protein
MTGPDPRTSERLRALTADIVTIVRRHAPDWTDENDADPGVTLIQLLAWLADALSAYQDQAAGEAALDTRRKLAHIAHHVLSDAAMVVTVDGEIWRPVAPKSPGRVDDRTYVVETAEDGSATIRFGDAVAGDLPDTGSEVTASYEFGSGAAGLTVTVRWPPKGRAITVELGAAALAFKPGADPPRTISGVPTSVTAFIGRALRGKVNDPVPIRSFAEYELEFGGLWVESTLGYAVHQFFLNGGSEALIIRVGEGADGCAITDGEITGSGLEAAQAGLWALEKADLFNILCIPPLTHAKDIDPAATLLPALAYCRARRAMLIVDPPSRWNLPADVMDGSSGLASLGLQGEDATNATLYFPRVRLPDPLNGGQLTTFAPCGMVAGIYARTDAQRGVWTAPAGRDASLRGVAEPAHRLTDADTEMLNSLGVNAIRALPAPESVVVWGGRTLSGADRLGSEWKYIPVRRLGLYIEESLLRGTQWAVFEPNDERLWNRLRLQVDAFMHGLLRQGAFPGLVPGDAYFVRCGADTMTQGDIEQGRLNVMIGFAPLKPAEFIIVRIQHLVGRIGG